MINWIEGAPVRKDRREEFAMPLGRNRQKEPKADLFTHWRETMPPIGCHEFSFCSLIVLNVIRDLSARLGSSPNTRPHAGRRTDPFTWAAHGARNDKSIARQQAAAVTSRAEWKILRA
jgi:hypothetical protein